MRLLTFRRLAVLVRHMPPESPVAIALGSPGWRVGDFLLSDLYHATTGKAHPARPKPSKVNPVKTSEQARKVRSARRRANARREAIRRGEIS